MHYNTNKIMNSALPGIKPEELFLAGDIRSNENVLLSALHTLFVREHNRLCDLIINIISIHSAHSFSFQLEQTYLAVYKPLLCACRRYRNNPHPAQCR